MPFFFLPDTIPIPELEYQRYWSYTDTASGIVTPSCTHSFYWGGSLGIDLRTRRYPILNRREYRRNFVILVSVSGTTLIPTQSSPAELHLMDHVFVYNI